MTAELRNQVLRLDPETIGLAARPDRPDVWAGMMDFGYRGSTWASLVVIGDGTVSLYTSTGGGVIGAGTHESVAVAAHAWLSLLQERLDLLAPTEQLIPPATGRVTIRALTFAGQRAVEADEDDLGHLRHPAGILFHAAHEVLTAVRLAEGGNRPR